MEDTDPLRLAFLEQSDLGNAERLKALAQGKLKWVEDLGVWAFYDGRRFDTERGGVAAQRLAHQVVRHIRLESAAAYELHDRCEKGDADAHEQLSRLKGPKYDWTSLKSLGSGLLKHALKSGSASMTAGMLRQARSDLACLVDDFDRNPLIYNCRNRTLEFVERDGGWTVVDRPHDPADLLMRVADVDYAPDAPCPFWRERFDQLQPDAEQRDALKLLYGYTLTGLTSDQAFYVHQGKGNDGKSATHMALGELHGDYYRHAGVKTFLDAGGARGGAEHRSDLVRLRGDVRFVTCDEPKARSVWDGETIKQVTGSLITARGSNERTEITYRPRFKLNPECNIIPRAPSDDKGFRRRFKLFQWTVSLPVAGEDGYMPIDQVLGRLRDERSGILNWLIEGACEWLATRTIPQPAAMAAVLGDFWTSSSPLMDWMEEWTDCSDPEAATPVKDLWDAFKSWKEAQGIETGPATTTAFGNALRDKQFAVFKDKHGNRWRRGIRLLGQAEHDLFVAGSASPHANPDADPAFARAAEAASRPAPGSPRAASSSAAEPTHSPGGSTFDEDVP